VDDDTEFATFIGAPQDQEACPEEETRPVTVRYVPIARSSAATVTSNS
jgi:hypothetical protein